MGSQRLNQHCPTLLQPLHRRLLASTWAALTPAATLAFTADCSGPVMCWPSLCYLVHRRGKYTCVWKPWILPVSQTVQLLAHTCQTAAHASLLWLDNKHPGRTLSQHLLMMDCLGDLQARVCVSIPSGMPEPPGCSPAFHLPCFVPPLTVLMGAASLSSQGWHQPLLLEYVTLQLDVKTQILKQTLSLGCSHKL